MSKQRKFLVIVLAGAAFQSLPAQPLNPPDTYSVTQINAMLGPSTAMEIYRDGNRAVVEQTKPSGTHVRTLYDIKAGRTFSIDLAQPGAQCSSGSFSGDWGDPFATSGQLARLNPKPLGNATVNGMPVKMLEASLPGQAAPVKVALDPKSGLILKLEMGGKTMIEVKKFSFTRPPASAFAMPAACSEAMATPTESEVIAAVTGGTAAEFINAAKPPRSPSDNSCTVLFRIVNAGSMTPITSGFQVAIDPTVDADRPTGYHTGVGPDGRKTFSGGLKELTDQLQNGALRINSVPARFLLELDFGDAGSSSAMIYRQCFGPQTVLLYVVKNAAKLSDGANYWLWDKFGKYAP